MSDDFEEVKARPGAALIVGGRRELVVEPYEQVIKILEEAEPGAWVQFTGYTDFPGTDKRVIQRVAFRPGVIFAVEDCNDAWLDAIEEERQLEPEGAENDWTELPPALRGLFGGFRNE